MRRLSLTLSVVLLALAGCGSDYGSDGGKAAPAADTAADTGASTGKEAQADASSATIKLADSQYGEVLFDDSGQAIYLFDKETSATSECYDECAAEWPPVLTEGEPQAGRGIDQKLLGTTERDDGTTQVTYNDHPLYFYAHEGRNQVLCHDVPGFGGTWLALGADGNRID